MSNLSDFLINDYAPYFGVTWDPATMALRAAVPPSVVFEIIDGNPTIVQPHGSGVSVIRRGQDNVEVIDLEDFMKKIHGQDSMPLTCDFAISPVVGSAFILLNELTETQSKYILPFVQENDGIEQEGKLEHARKQLTETINRFYEVSNFCDQYESRTALFPCKLSDKRGNGLMARSARAFSASIHKIQKMKLNVELPHGFVMKMRVYEAEYRIG